MISSVRGPVLHIGSDAVVIDVGGVGLSVAVTPQVSRALRTGETAMLHTTLIVREDSLSLFGFDTRDELEVFSLLLGVTGVGPKSALGVLASLSVDQIADAVANDDDAPFRRVSGIGPKTAKLIVVQLAGKLAARARSGAVDAVTAPDVSAQVVAALAGLGWSERVAVEAVAGVLETAGPADRGSVPVLLRMTLAELGPARKEPVGG
ncbi:Holliday junction branch migration protein RuvA [Microbacterium sp. ARD31]|jgi:Holliday junction DNA helicase RuvA|uniref:Holliday junction branch migration protein RuvA n=1 Tax=Microbacterium sp. ARD31 TaxID=2962576 RepID=UPI0028810236|nr:Holliday junction branch migration protein RuvA [Microbacterium sp. ARD31]MDT0181343.1 Holliday junction branch migration protein RuvA [Microbacterium sp. ARD31]